MNAENELKSLRLQREAKEALYRKRRSTTKVVFIFLGVVAIGAMVNAFVQQRDANQLRMLAESSAEESRGQKAGTEKELSSCNADLENLKVSLAECQSQNPKK